MLVPLPLSHEQPLLSPGSRLGPQRQPHHHVSSSRPALPLPHGSCSLCLPTRLCASSTPHPRRHPLELHPFLTRDTSQVALFLPNTDCLQVTQPSLLQWPRGASCRASGDEHGGLIRLSGSNLSAPSTGMVISRSVMGCSPLRPPQHRAPCTGCSLLKAITFSG